MKTAILVVLTMVSTQVFAESIQKECYARSEKAVKRSSSPDRYDKDGIEAQRCSIAANKAAVVCEVSASKGDGAASDTYTVVLAQNCKKVLRLELTGEE